MGYGGAIDFGYFLVGLWLLILLPGLSQSCSVLAGVHGKHRPRFEEIRMAQCLNLGHLTHAVGANEKGHVNT